VSRPSRLEPSRGPYYVALIVLALFAIGPLVTLVFNALKSNFEIGASPLTPPKDLRFGNFVDAWQRGDFAMTMRNSAILTVGTVVGVCVIASLAAYALTYLDVPGGGFVVAWLFLSVALPVQLFLVPLFFMWSRLELSDTLLGLMVIYWAVDAPFLTLLLRSYLQKIPHEFVEAARLDGANELQILVRVIVPMARPAVATVGLLAGLFAWNEYFWARTFIQSPDRRPIATSFLSFQDQASTDWSLTSAAAIFTIGPVIVLFLVLQRRFIAGLTSGGIK
jgi:raffinose/stachyose/melibiose transport system permease protein